MRSFKKKIKSEIVKILHFILLRKYLTDEIGAIKQKSGIAVYDKDRENQLKNMRKTLCAKYDIDYLLIEEMFETLIKNSKKSQIKIHAQEFDNKNNMISETEAMPAINILRKKIDLIDKKIINKIKNIRSFILEIENVSERKIIISSLVENKSQFTDKFINQNGANVIDATCMEAILAIFK